MHVSVQNEQPATKCVLSGTGTTEKVRQCIGIRNTKSPLSIARHLKLAIDKFFFTKLC